MLFKVIISPGIEFCINPFKIEKASSCDYCPMFWVGQSDCKANLWIIGAKVKSNFFLLIIIQNNCLVGLRNVMFINKCSG